jgi:hypothetical protein
MKRRAFGILRVAVTALAIAGCTAWYLMPSGNAIVQPIEVRVRGRNAWVSGTHATVYPSHEDLRSALSDSDIQLGRDVDFSRENLVRVAWQATGCGTDEMVRNHWKPGGPLFGKLACCARMGGRKILFYVDEPIQSGTVHQVFQQIQGTDWFTVPKRSHVAIGSRLQVIVHDTLFGLLLAVAAGVIVATATRRIRVSRFKEENPLETTVPSADGDFEPVLATTKESQE